jgi:hypothetical protein
LERSAREADKKDFVSLLVVLTQETIAAADAVTYAETDGARCKGQLAKTCFGGDADFVVHDLANPACVGCKDSALQLDDIGLVRVFRLVPGPIEKAHQPFHSIPSPWKRSGQPIMPPSM